MPAVSVTRTCIVLLAVNVWPAKLQVLAPSVAVAVVQLAPLSNETCTDSPVSRFAFRVPLIVCAAVLVLKSVALAPVSAEKVTVDMVLVGLTVSNT